MDDGSMTLWVALVVLVALSAFFSASETAFSSLNQIRLKSRAEDGDNSAARVLAMAEKYDKLLSTILIGNNIVNIAAASIGTKCASIYCWVKSVAVVVFLSCIDADFVVFLASLHGNAMPQGLPQLYRYR